MRKLLATIPALTLAVTLQNPNPVYAYVPGDEQGNGNTTSFGTCTLRRDLENANSRALLWLVEPDEMAGGTFFNNGTITPANGSISAASIEGCIGAGVGTVAVTAQNGADGSFATDDDSSFSFTLSTAVTGFGVGTHTYSLVSGSSFTASTSAPTANAGTDQIVASAASVTLDGSTSDANDVAQSLSYAWTQTSGPTVTLTGDTTASPTFTAPALVIGDADATLIFSLTVTDPDGSDTDTVQVTVNAPVDNTAPGAPTASCTRDDSGVITLTGTAEANASINIILPDASTANTTASGVDGSYSFTSGAGIPEGNASISAVDGFMNTSPSTTASCTTATTPVVSETETVISNFQESRARNLQSNMPNLAGIVYGDFGGALSADITRGRGFFEFDSSYERSGWVRMRGSWSTNDTTDNSYVLGAVGSHTKLTPNAHFGAMLVFDRATSDDGTAETSGTGWLVGPYTVVKHPDQPLIFDGTLLFGRTSNETSPAGTYTDSYDGKRVLANMNVSGNVAMDRFVLTPRVGASWSREVSQAYTDSNSASVPQVTQSNLTLAIGFDVRVPVMMETGSLDLLGGMTGFMSQTEDSAGDDRQENSAQVSAGAHYVTEDETHIRVKAFVDGLGLDDYEGFGLELTVSKEF